MYLDVMVGQWMCLFLEVQLTSLILQNKIAIHEFGMYLRMC